METSDPTTIPLPRPHRGADPGAAPEPDGGAGFAIASGSARVLASAAELPRELRARAFAGQAKDFRYYQITAETLGAQFEHRFLVVRHAETGAEAVQPVFFVDQDILEGLPGKLHAVLAAPRRFFPRWLRLRMLVAGGSAGDAALDCAEPWAVAALREALGSYARQTRAAMILLKDFPAAYRAALQPFTAAGYGRVPSMPGCALDLDFGSFEEFMRERLGRTLRYKYGKLARQPAIPCEVLTDITPLAGELHALYLQTYERSKMRFEKLTPEFFARLGREMPDRARFFLWRVEGRLAAFALCLVHAGTMHHLNIGFDYAVSLDRQLYLVTMRDLLRWALAHGVSRYETGQLNYEPKLRLRMRLAPLDLYARHRSPLLNPLFQPALRLLQPVRYDPVIPRFPNAADL